MANKTPGHQFVVDKRYEFQKLVGKGSYGFVCSSKDTVTGDLVAIKKIPNAFEDSQDIKRLYREIRLLRHFKHENILGLRTILCPPEDSVYRDVYLVTDLMDTDLYQILSSSQPLTEEHFQYFLYQIMRGVKFLHAGSVLHRDLKPSNLLINEDCDLKICDFGMARPASDCASAGDGEEEKESTDMTLYVVTRWYRPPELLLSSKEYTKAVDIWSVGCILGEMLGRQPLFPGKDYFHQLSLIIELLGTPTKEDLLGIRSQNTRSMMAKLPVREPVPLEKKFPQANPLALDLLSKMLVLNPRKRLTVEEVLCHPYLSALYDPRDLAVSTVPDVFDASFEATEDKERLTELVLDEVKLMNPSWNRRSVHLNGASRSHDDRGGGAAAMPPAPP